MSTVRAQKWGSSNMTTHQPGVHMERELRSQPELWLRAAELASSVPLPSPRERVAVIGCGTSWFVAQCYAALREAAGGETDAFAASEAPVLGRAYDAVVLLSRSGTTTEVLQLAERLDGASRRIGIYGDESSPLPGLVDEQIALPWADEQSVVQTRFATTALTLMRAHLGADIEPIASDAHTVLHESPSLELIEARQITFLGRGWTVGLAHEAALKLRESSQSWTESYPAMDYRHGPIAIAAEGRAVWAFGEVPVGLDAEITRTGARFEHRAIDPLAELVRAHVVALERARALGLDPDVPRNLSRSVILET